MKFQNPSFKFFLNGRTDKQMDKQKAICSPLFQMIRSVYTAVLPILKNMFTSVHEFQ